VHGIYIGEAGVRAGKWLECQERRRRVDISSEDRLESAMEEAAASLTAPEQDAGAKSDCPRIDVGVH
jgi:hypothetical protein